LLDLQSQASSLQSQVNPPLSQIGDNRTEARRGIADQHTAYVGLGGEF
jgi:hypothetical protein